MRRLSSPFFSEALDADPSVKAWLASLSDAERRSLRDDVTPSFKEIPSARVPEPERHHDDEEPERLSEVVLESLRAPQDELFPELGGDVFGVIARAAREHLPDWQYRAFIAWARGSNRVRISKALGVSRSTVRSSLDGEGHRGGTGAIAAVTEHLASNTQLREAVTAMATKVVKQQERRASERVLGWFKETDRKPEMIEPLAMLLVLDDMADARREVPVADLLGKFARSRITPCLALLRAHGFAVSNGRVIKIHKTPGEEQTR